VGTETGAFAIHPNVSKEKNKIVWQDKGTFM
jgi:hypothetical protein